jgi:hypothetical protein
MKAMKTKGLRKGELVEVYQWCNDWFSIEDDAGGIVLPTSLAFDDAGRDIIMESEYGFLFNWFHMYKSKVHKAPYHWIFRKVTGVKTKYRKSW